MQAEDASKKRGDDDEHSGAEPETANDFARPKSGYIPDRVQQLLTGKAASEQTTTTAVECTKS